MNPTESTIRCPLCGRDGIPHDASFCPYCRQRLYRMAGLDHTELVTERTRGFTGREWVFRAIDDWLGTPNGRRFFLLAGEPGCGKTAIAARLAQFAQGTAPPPEGLARLAPGFLSAFHFCSARDHRWINPHSFAESLALQLSRYPEYASVLANLSVTAQSQQPQPLQVVHQKIEEVNDQGQAIGILNIIERVDVSSVPPEDAFVRVVQEPLEFLCKKRPRQQVIILIDALDEALIYSGTVSIVTLLARCRELPANARFLVTTLPRADVLRPLQRDEPQECWLSTDPGLAHSLDDVKAYVLRVLDQRPELAGNLAADLSRVAFADAVRDKSQGNFLYVNYLLETLQARHAEISRKSLDDPPTGLSAIYLEFLERLLADDGSRWEERYAPILGTLMAAQESLTEKQLAAFVRADRSQVRRVLSTLRPLLDVDGSLPASKRTWAVYHRSFVDLLLDEDQAEEYWCEEPAQHNRIVAYYLGQFEGSWRRCDGYGLRYLPVHMVEAGQHEQLRELLLDCGWMQAKLEATDVMALAADYDLLPGEAAAGLAEAVSCFRQATQMDPEYLAAWEAIVWLQQTRAMHDLQARDFSAAASKLAEALSAANHTDPLDPSALTRRGYSAKTLAQLERARGNLTECQERLQEAKGSFRRAVQLNPKEMGGWNGLGNIQALLGDHGSAIESYERAIELAPTYTAAHHDLAISCEAMMRSDPAHAMEWCRKALDAWQTVYELAPMDPGFSASYAGTIGQRVQWLRRQCGEGT
jgi:tetratricopeptide (TPR) repeat protein